MIKLTGQKYMIYQFSTIKLSMKKIVISNLVSTFAKIVRKLHNE